MTILECIQLIPDRALSRRLLESYDKIMNEPIGNKNIIQLTGDPNIGLVETAFMNALYRNKINWQHIDGGIDKYRKYHVHGYANSHANASVMLENIVDDIRENPNSGRYKIYPMVYMPGSDRTCYTAVLTDAASSTDSTMMLTLVSDSASYPPKPNMDLTIYTAFDTTTRAPEYNVAKYLIDVQKGLSRLDNKVLNEKLRDLALRKKDDRIMINTRRGKPIKACDMNRMNSSTRRARMPQNINSLSDNQALQGLMSRMMALTASVGADAVKYPALCEALMGGYKGILLEKIFSDFGRKLVKGTIIAAMSLGLLTHADAAPKKAPTVQRTKDAPTMTVKKQTVKKTKSGTTTVTQAHIKNLANSEAYQDRVTQLLEQMTQDSPSMNPDKMYREACKQAMQEVMDGKLKL